jgi:signal transduction histidine kinase
VAADGRPAWLLLLGPKGGGSDYDDEDMQLLATVSSQLAISLQRVEAFRGLREANRKLEETVAELRRAQRELALRERLAVIGRMAATIAHEVRNPLGVMKIAARTLGDRFPAGAQERELSDFINLEVDKLNRVVSDLLDFTREPELRRRAEPLRPVIEAAVARVAPAAGGRVAVEVVEEPPGVEASVQREAMERVFLNLLLNVVEAAGTGTVRVRAFREGAAAVVAVEDEGPGIDPKDAEAVFEPFHTTREGGTGLGLAVCAKIVSAHGGTINLDIERKRGARRRHPARPRAGPREGERMRSSSSTMKSVTRRPCRSA